MLASVSSDYLHLIYRPDLLVLVGRWMRQTSIPELRVGYGHILDEGESQD